MKKTFLIVLAAVVLCVAAVCILIPTKLNTAEVVSVDASDGIAYKFLITKSGWDKWWPGQKISDTHYRFKEADFYITKITNGDVYLKMQKDGLIFNSDISYLAGEEGSVNIKWIANGEAKSGLFSRIHNYFSAKAANEQIVGILNGLKHFLEDERNTYGYKIYLKLIKDTVLVTTSGTYTNEPSTAQIYAIIDNLKQQAKVQGATETNFPMLNVTLINEHQYFLNVALPINKPIKPIRKSVINNMPKGSNLLVADVHGGPNTAQNALNQIKNYMKDHRLSSPAMPFQLLITDRLAEKDTSKWITKIYYPIL